MSHIIIDSEAFDELEAALTAPGKPTEAIKEAAKRMRKLYPTAPAQTTGEDFIDFLRRQHADVGVTPALQEAYESYLTATDAQTTGELVPNPYRLVPKVPTREMLEAMLEGMDALAGHSKADQLENAYALMLEAAPSEPATSNDAAAATGELVQRLIGIATTLGLPWPPEYRQQVFDTAKDAATAIERLTAERDRARKSMQFFQDQNDLHGSIAEKALIRAETAEAERDEAQALHEHFAIAWDSEKYATKRALARAETAERQVAEMVATLGMIADIAEGSTTANSLPHIAKIARAALKSLEPK
jgi:hypothetical protein